MKWRDLRAGLLAIAIFFGLVDGCPLPSPAHTPDWKKGFVEPIRSAQRVVLTPVAWIQTRLRISQHWAVYQAPSRDRFRLWIEGRDQIGRWHVLFRAGDPAHQWHADRIDYTRPRGTWAPTSVPPGQYAAFARWAMDQVLVEHPTWIAARVRLETVRITDNAVVPTGDFVHTHMRLRDGPP